MNIDVSDGLANGALGKLVHLQRDDNDELPRVYIVFPHHRVSEKLKKKLQASSIAITLIRMIKISRRNSIRQKQNCER